MEKERERKELAQVEGGEGSEGVDREGEDFEG
jgi:hypothetical protein